jgi:hypothetical protein
MQDQLLSLDPDYVSLYRLILIMTYLNFGMHVCVVVNHYLPLYYNCVSLSFHSYNTILDQHIIKEILRPRQRKEDGK